MLRPKRESVQFMKCEIFFAQSVKCAASMHNSRFDQNNFAHSMNWVLIKLAQFMNWAIMYFCKIILKSKHNHLDLFVFS